jgi:hypothetical protein
MPVSLGSEQFREYFPSEDVVGDEKAGMLADDATSPRTGE